MFALYDGVIDSIKEKVAVITGGAHGIGKAIADAFRSKGADVYIIDVTQGDWFVGDIGDKESHIEKINMFLLKTAFIFRPPSLHSFYDRTQ